MVALKLPVVSVVQRNRARCRSKAAHSFRCSEGANHHMSDIHSKFFETSAKPALPTSAPLGGQQWPLLYSFLASDRSLAQR
jgi:hypothetical protein